MQLQNENIVKYIDSYFNEENYFCIVTEYCEVIIYFLFLNDHL